MMDLGMLQTRLAWLLTQDGWEWVGMLATAVTTAGVWYRWRSHWHLSDVEEDLKNDKISPDQAQRRSRWIEVRARTLIFGGLGLMVVAMTALLM